MRTPAFAALLLGLALAGCSKKEEPAPAPTGDPAAAAGKATTGGDNHGTATRRPSRAGMQPGKFPRLSLVPLAVADVAALWPEVAGARTLGEPTSQAGGRQVRQGFCLGTTDLPAAGEAVHEAVIARGFTAKPPQPRGMADRQRLVVSGSKDDLRLSANLIASTAPACDGKIEVLYTFHRVVKREPGATDPAGPASPPTEGAAPTPTRRPGTLNGE